MLEFPHSSKINRSYFEKPVFKGGDYLLVIISPYQYASLFTFKAFYSII